MSMLNLLNKLLKPFLISKPTLRGFASSNFSVFFSEVIFSETGCFSLVSWLSSAIISSTTTLLSSGEALGEVGFGIYKENEDGTLELLAYTNEYSYIYEGYEPTTIVIKAEHQKAKRTMRKKFI